MNMKKKFMISNIVMLVAPIILIGVITILFIGIFIFAVPTESYDITKLDLLDIRTLIQFSGEIFSKNPSAAKFIVLWLFLCLVIIIAIITLITVILSKSILKPIKELIKAADNIKGGNLNFEVLRVSDEEINELCVAFDEMRLKLKASKEQEEALKKERNMILANLSHDLKTPITSIKGYIKGIQDGVADTSEKMDKYLTTIYTKASAIDDMVNNLSSFSKLELSKLQFCFEIGDINQFLTDLCEEYKFDLEKKHITLDIEIASSPAYVKIDYEKMYRVFANLIDNAVKYKGSDDGYIKISSLPFRDGILITIRDNGIGIADSELKKVFDGFYRIDPARNLNIKGSGLGLGISKQIVEHHGGKLWFQGGLEKGTAALIFLPVRSNTPPCNEERT